MNDEVVAVLDRGDASEFGLLIARGELDANQRVLGAPLLVHAARKHLAAVVEVLLAAGARVDDADDDGETACHAVVHKSTTTTTLAAILRHNPNLALRDKGKRTPLDTALEMIGGKWTAMLIAAGAPLDRVDRMQLCFAAGLSRDIVVALHNRGFVVRDLVGHDGGSPLHSAVSRYGIPCMDVLVNLCGCDVNQRNRFSDTCARNALLMDDDVALRWLLEAGANFDDKNGLGKTLLLQACDNRASRCALLLLAFGADVHARTFDGSTASDGLANTQTRSRPPSDGVLISRMLLTFGADPKVDESARRDVAKARLGFVRDRALHVCVGLHSRGLDALVMCEILLYACGRMSPLVEFHHWWKIATAVKHFQ
jgi:ankyrin repeat protein